MNDDANKPEKLFCWNFKAKQDAWKSGWGGYCRQGNLSAMDERERITGAVYVRADLVPDAQAIREAALREARQRVNDLVAERLADLHGARNDFNRGAVAALQEACSAILALLSKGGA